MHLIRPRTLLLPLALWVACPAPAFAYMGPGIGLGAIGAAMGIIVSLLLVTISVIWYPLKRLFRRKRGKRGGRDVL
ncbi:MAG TPA: hypothetical protein VK533_10230 [Sphingomonas sp.]|uniref:hypothetical protein n=1 Tax=Sphingomonas sp. TaxID=28214 RepID=UPI002B6DEFA3|nr:hypothetical protein [Sphingomonas sp.]HMI19911.1 hypothetical protein [Sphingomonas sp.]